MAFFPTPSLEATKQQLERKERLKKRVKISILLVLFLLLIASGIMIVAIWHSPDNFAALEKLLINKDSSITLPSGKKQFTKQNLSFTYPAIYEIQEETAETTIFSGRQEDGQQFPSVLSVNLIPSIDHESMYPCSQVTFRQGITSQCKEEGVTEKSINGYAYREFIVVGGKGGEEKLRQRVIQFLNPPHFQITHLLFNGVENRLDDILPTIHITE